jgi:glycosyltransferase involved in cell wall biosynthesis
MWEHAVETVEDIGWFEFDDAITHHLPSTRPTSWSGDVMFGTGAGPEVDALPATYLQGVAIVDRASEWEAFRQPGLKICVASWLVEVARHLGSPGEQCVVVPPGLDHDTFRVTSPIGGRVPSVAMLLHLHPGKGSAVGLAALRQVHELRPEARVTLFSAHETNLVVPDWAHYEFRPDHRRLGEIFNSTAVFVQPSHFEGFGLPAIQAMASGSTLVTTDNGGSLDYAFNDDTALVTAPGDADALARAVVHLLDHEADRIRLAEAGARHVQRFTWDTSAELLERHLRAYVDTPSRYQHPPGPSLIDDTESNIAWASAVLRSLTPVPRFVA